MKKKLVLAVLLTAVLTAAAMFSVIALALRPTTLQVQEVDMSRVHDGEYIGIYQNKLLLAVVRVEVFDHQIMEIEVLQHKESYMPQARQTAEQVVEQQSLQVDTIAGATFTCDTVRKAVENALLQGIE